MVRDSRPGARIGVHDEASELATPTAVDLARPAAADAGRTIVESRAQLAARHGADFGTPTEVTRPEKSEPLHIISMKDQLGAQQRRIEERRVPLHVQLRSLAEVSGRNDTPVNLGHLAPPRDPHKVRASQLRANVLWVCVAIALACAISLTIWFVAGR